MKHLILKTVLVVFSMGALGTFAFAQDASGGKDPNMKMSASQANKAYTEAQTNGTCARCALKNAVEANLLDATTANRVLQEHNEAPLQDRGNAESSGG